MKILEFLNGGRRKSKDVLRDLSRLVNVALDRVLASMPIEKVVDTLAPVNSVPELEPDSAPAANTRTTPPPTAKPMPSEVVVQVSSHIPARDDLSYDRPSGDFFRWNPQYVRPPRIAAEPAPYVEIPKQSPWQWSEPQFRYYCYWRSEFLKDNLLPTDTAYVLEFAREGSRIHSTFDSLLAEWERLRSAYPHVPCMRFDRWLGVGRLVSGRYQFTEDEQGLEFETSHSADAGWIGFDLALLSGRSPRSQDMRNAIDLLLQAPLSWRAKNAIRETVERLRYVSGADSVAAIATSAPPKDVTRRVFMDNPECWRYYKTPGGNRFRRGQDGQLNALIPSFIETARVRHEIERLVAEALLFVDGDGSSSIPQSRANKYPEFDTLEGLIVTARYALSEEALILLAVVLRMSEIKPWIEGQIALSKDLRRVCDRAFAGVGVVGGLSALKRAYFALLAGSRAPWACEDRPVEANSLKLNTTRARFARNLQRELLGSASRNRIVDEITSILAERRHAPLADISKALSSETICGGQE